MAVFGVGQYMDGEGTVTGNNSYGKENGTSLSSVTSEEWKNSGCSEDNVRTKNGYLRCLRYFMGESRRVVN